MVCVDEDVQCTILRYVCLHRASSMPIHFGGPRAATTHCTGLTYSRRMRLLVRTTAVTGSCVNMRQGFWRTAGRRCGDPAKTRDPALTRSGTRAAAKGAAAGIGTGEL